jgi:hypothetical protein
VRRTFASRGRLAQSPNAPDPRGSGAVLERARVVKAPAWVAFDVSMQPQSAPLYGVEPHFRFTHIAQGLPLPLNAGRMFRNRQPNAFEVSRQGILFDREGRLAARDIESYLGAMAVELGSILGDHRRERFRVAPRLRRCSAWGWARFVFERPTAGDTR